MDYLTPKWDAPAHVGALATTRHGGVSGAPYDDGAGGGGLNLGSHVGDAAEHVERNRALLGGLVGARPAWLAQVHGTVVVEASNAISNAISTVQADASIAAEPGLACAVLTADCLPVLLCDVAGKAVGAAHAGWRGLANGVLENTVARLRDVPGTGELLAWLGPAIGPANFEVGDDVLQAFAAWQPQARRAFAPIPGKPGKYLADIYALARMRLEAVGVQRVSGGDYCTVSDRRFYSYRRDSVTGRMASLIWLNPH